MNNKRFMDDGRRRSVPQSPIPIVSEPKAVRNIPARVEREMLTRRTIPQAAYQVDWSKSFLIIFAYSKAEAAQCAALHKVPHDKWVYLQDATVLLMKPRGVINLVVWRYGKYFQRPDVQATEGIIEARKLIYTECPS